jgi:preprotein translocase subunit SecY
MEYFNRFLRNLALLVGIFIILLLLFPDMMGDILTTYWAVFGPIALLILIGAALPNKKRK